MPIVHVYDFIFGFQLKHVIAMGVQIAVYSIMICTWKLAMVAAV